MSTGITGRAFISSLHEIGSVPQFSGECYIICERGKSLDFMVRRHALFSSMEGQAGCPIFHVTESQCCVCRFLCVGDSNSFTTLYSKRLRTQCVHLRHETGSAWPLERGRGVYLSDPFGLPLFCFGNSDCYRVFSKSYSPSPPNCASEKTDAKQHLWKCPHVISGFNLESGPGLRKRWEGKFSCPGDFVCFLSLSDFFPLKMWLWKADVQ